MTMSQTAKPFSADVLKLDAEQEAHRIASSIRETIAVSLKRKGAIIGLSGGIDSSVVAALCVRALGKDRVFGLFMPETDSSDDSLKFGRLIAGALGIQATVEDISPILRGAGCYTRRDEAIKAVIPHYNDTYQSKIVLSSVLSGSAYRIFSVVVRAPDGTQTKARLSADAYLGVVAATNFKQRVRKMIEYYHADRLNFAVAGTPNRLEYDQGFFVKNGDGAADFKPIAHLYKTQVYQLAAYLDVPIEIQRRPPTTDTYSLEQSQEEFYFSLPYDKMDVCLYGKNHGVSPSDVAAEVGLTAQQVASVYKDIDAKRQATRYLHTPPVLVEKAFDV
jgi:NAD+ synthase